MLLGRRGAVVCALLSAILTVVVTWPLFARPASRVLDATSIYGAAAPLVQRDVNLTLWVLAWDCHALATAPAALFDANAFYPARRSLALSEHMLGNVPLFAPAYAATANPVLAHQLALLATFVLAALAMRAYVLHWTGDEVASLAAGLVFALAPFRLWQVGNLHVISIHALPLVPLGIDLALAGRRRAGGVLLATGLVVSALCSYYVGYAAFALAGAYGLVALPSRGDRRGVVAVALAGVLAGIVVLLLTTPYLALQREGVIPARSQESGFVSLAFIGVMREGPLGMAEFFLWRRRDGVPLFLGFTVMALATAGAIARRRAPRGALAAAALVGYVLVLGPSYARADRTTLALPYRWLASLVPGFSAMRVPQRFGAITTVAVVALAGVGLAWIRSGLLARGRRRLAGLIPALVVAAAMVEGWPGRVRTVEMPVGPTMPPATRWLAAHGEGGAMIELPVPAYDLLGQSVAVYRSTAHWLPIANGYAPYAPDSFRRVMEAASRLPAPAALDEMLGVAPFRWIVVRRAAIPRGAAGEWERTFGARGLRVAADFGDTAVYEVPRQSTNATLGKPQ
jgi:hypothetical protein